VILDTNVIIRIMQGNPKVIRTVKRLERNQVRLNVSLITVYELYHSLERVSNPEERQQTIEAVLNSKPKYPADEVVMKKAGRIDGRLTANGREIGAVDTIIAATAVVHEESILTENVKHFERVDGLSVETY